MSKAVFIILEVNQCLLFFSEEKVIMQDKCLNSLKTNAALPLSPTDLISCHLHLLSCSISAMNDLLQSEGCLDEDSGKQEDQAEEQIMQHTIAISKKHSTSSLSFHHYSSIDNHTIICNQGTKSKCTCSSALLLPKSSTVKNNNVQSTIETCQKPLLTP